jgi:signal transduction histidine kinase/CheY-like chemotaxis protein
MSEKPEVAKKRNKVLTFMVIIALIVVVCLGGHWFFDYTKDMIYKESVSQLNELSSQVIEKLETQLEIQWDYVRKFAENCDKVNSMEQEEIAEEISDYERYLSPSGSLIRLRAIDEKGCYYTAEGRNGQWTGLDKLDREASTQSFLITNWLDDTYYMAFVIKSSGNLTVDGNKITHYVLLRTMDDMQKYFHSTAFGEQNMLYIIDTNGHVMFKDGSLDGIELEGNNLFKNFKDLTFPHIGSFEDVLAKVSTDSSVCTDVELGDKNVFLVYDSMPQYDWEVLYLVSSDDVATSTAEMINAVIKMVGILLLLIVLAVIVSFVILLRSLYDKKALEIKIESEKRLEAANRVLEDTNIKLEQSYKETENALETAQKATKAKSNFLANMSHDIRTPMNAIIGLTKLMEGDIDDKEKMHYYIQKLEHSGNYMLGLINDILDMSKIESGEVNLNQGPLKMAEQAGQIESIIRSQSAEKNQNFTVTVHEVTHEYLIGDSIRVRQIFINLLNNAVKYTPVGGSICFEIREIPCDKEGCATILTSVIDNGIGMTPEYLEHIFEPFTREESSVTNKIQGTGLGMSITKSLIDLMGGEIRVESKVGKGTRFDVLLTLPIDTEREYNAHVNSVLLISDEDIFTENMEASLKGKSVKFASASTVEEAVVSVDERKPDVIILSGYLENKNLTGIVKVLREKAGEDVLIFCSDYAHKSLVKNLLTECGVDGFIPRPFFFDNFSRAIECARTKNDNNDSERRSPLSGKRFLCAEDNDLNAEILDALLCTHGASCVIYPSGVEITEAFADVKKGDYDAILMDVQMPKMDGMQAARAIRSSDNPLGRDIPIIAMTANAFSSDVQDCLAAGMDAHLAKPIDLVSLERTLHEVLTKKSVRNV